MRILSVLMLVLAAWEGCFALDAPAGHLIHVIPIPASVKIEPGRFQLNESTAVVSSSELSSGVAGLLAAMLRTPSGFALPVVKGSAVKKGNAIVLELGADPQLGDEGYVLRVSPERIVITANKAAGLFYGAQTVRQLLPAQIESKAVVRSVKWEVPCVQITDYPRFAWRGLMLDVSRHFFSKEFVKRYIDEMAKYKFNVFHWHLTDDNGWRIEVKGLPKLTEVGAWRVPRTGTWETFDPPHPGEPATYGGYYTEDDIREVIAYAKERFVTILPEIDVPGHSRALNASYPILTCPGLQYSVDPGTRSFREDDNQICIARDSTWEILDKIFTRVAELFPSEYIHVGCDEVHTEYWENDPKEQALMKREGITNVDGLQGYFAKQIEKLVRSKGKKVIGWYELNDQLTTEAAYMSWRDMKTGIAAAKKGNPVVMAPSEFCYLDNEVFRVSDSYRFEPVPEGVGPKLILGGEACLWTEQVPNERRVDYMTWPRALAIAEVLWSPKSRQDTSDFLYRIREQFRYLDAARVNHSLQVYDPIITAVKGRRICSECDDPIELKLTTEMPGTDIYYAFDGTNPDNFYPKYEGNPVPIPKGATEIRVISYLDGKPAGHQINLQLSELGHRER